VEQAIALFENEIGDSMNDEEQTKNQLLRKLAELRQRIARLEESEAKRMQAEAAWHQSEERYRRIFDSSQLVIGIIDAAGNVLELNRAIHDFTGYAPEEIIGKHALELPFMPGESKARAMERLSQTIQGKKIGPYDLNIVTKQGEARIGSIVTNPIRDDNGKLIGALVMASDVTEQRRAEEALRQSEETYKTITENVNVGVYRNTSGPRGKFIEANPAIVKMFGYENRNEFLSVDVADLYQNPEDRKKFNEKMLRDGFVKNEELRLQRKDGIPFYGSVSAVAVTDAQGHVKYYDGIIEDITERKKAEEKFRMNHEKLQKIIDATVNALASTTEKRDPYTAGHPQRVTQLACAIAQEMGLSEDKIEGIRVAGIVHDIGKIHVAAEILNKPLGLSDAEMNLVKTHCEVGYEILKNIEFPWPVAEILRQHHERVDGTGYPHGLSGEEILIEARILAVADVIEAMVSQRAYRSAYSIAQAMEEISKNRGQLYDPQVVDTCIKLFDKGFQFESREDV